MPNETILIVDDSIEFTEILSKVLQTLGYQTFIAYNGSDGLNQMLTTQPDLVMLDMQMPGLSGLNVLEALQHVDQHPPVIFMTVEGSEETAVQAFRLGARNYINKQFSIDDIEKVIDEALRENRLLRRKIDLQNNLLAAKTVRQTVVTLSHHINNHLMSTSGNLELLQEALAQEPNLINQTYLVETLQNSHQSLEKIKEILTKLKELNIVEPITYRNQESMLDTVHKTK